MKNQGYHVEIFMGKRKSLPRMDLLEADLVGISTTTSTSYEAYRIATYLRNRGIPVVIGGIHATFLPEEALNYADYVVRGEAESSFPAKGQCPVSESGLKTAPYLSVPSGQKP